MYLLGATPTSNTYRFHPHPPSANHMNRFPSLPTIVIHTLNIDTLNFVQVHNMDVNCGKWVKSTRVVRRQACVESMGLASGCGEGGIEIFL